MIGHQDCHSGRTRPKKTHQVSSSCIRTITFAFKPSNRLETFSQLRAVVRESVIYLGHCRTNASCAVDVDTMTHTVTKFDLRLCASPLSSDMWTLTSSHITNTHTGNCSLKELFFNYQKHPLNPNLLQQK